ncbi:MAG: hypothetical protein ACNA8W_23420, partial [Bradymonadaceae bacterium]
GLAGASLAGGLIDIDLERLLGESFVAEANIPGLGGGEFPLPGGIVAHGRVFGFNLDLKQEYFVNTSAGARLGWGMAGKVPFQTLLGLFTDGGGGGMSEMLGTLLPLFNRFDHSIQPMHIDALPRILDTADINNNGITNEWVPNYRAFPVVSLRPNVRQQLATEVRISNFPILDGSEASLAVLVGGASLDGPGFLPLGISATTDSDEDGRPDARLLYMAAPHGSAVGGRFAIMALAVGGGNDDFMTPTNFSAALWTGQSLPTSISLGTFPDSTDGTVNRDARSIDLSAGAGPMYRVRVTSLTRSWDIWSMGEPGVMGEFTHTVMVPEVPGDHADFFELGAPIIVDAIRTSVTLDDLVRATGVGLRNVGLVTTSYNRTALP